MKICSGCRLEKEDREFYTRKNTACGLRAQCKDCEKTFRKTPKRKLAWQRYNNTQQRQENSRRYSQSDKGHKAIQLYYQSDEGRLMRQLWRQSKKGRLLTQQYSRHRREQKLKLDYQFTKEDVQLVYDRFNYCCFRCQRTDYLTIDHHYPLSLGCGLTLQNAVLLCQPCNSSKNNKMPEEFYTPKQLNVLKELL